MHDRLNKTSICSIVFLDIVGYSQRPVAEQIRLKDRFNQLLGDAVTGVAPADRIILDTGDGAAIALMGAPEDALFIALSILDGIVGGRGHDRRGGGVADNTQAVADLARVALPALQVRIGINLGPVRVVNDINGHPNIIGDGINVAQRVMSFAEPNQILVSRSYYEVTSRLSDEFAHMFAYSGVKQDKHVREHEVYAVMPGENPAAGAKVEEDDAAKERQAPWVRRMVMGGAALVLLVTIVSALMYFRDVARNASIPASGQASAPQVQTVPAVPVADVSQAQTVVAAPPPKQESVSAAPLPKPQPAPKKRMPRKADQAHVPQPSAHEPPSSREASAAPQEKNVPQEQKEPAASGWQKFKQSVKQGATKPECTAAQRSLHQCE
jgi:class 3 adenylate cyclase